MLQTVANLSDINAVRLDKLVYGSLNQLRQVTIDFIHAYIIQLVEAVAMQCTAHSIHKYLSEMNAFITAQWKEDFCAQLHYCTSPYYPEARYRSSSSHLLLATFTRVADMPSRRRLRSASTDQLLVLSYRQSTIGQRAFPIAGAHVWNGLPFDVIPATSLAVFGRRLKTELFCRYYNAA